jgi:hypothetical protein
MLRSTGVDDIFIFTVVIVKKKQTHQTTLTLTSIPTHFTYRVDYIIGVRPTGELLINNIKLN